MEYWSVDKKDINPPPISPTLQYSKIICNCMVPRWITFFWFLEAFLIKDILFRNFPLKQIIRPYLIGKYNRHKDDDNHQHDL